MKKKQQKKHLRGRKDGIRMLCLGCHKPITIGIRSCSHISLQDLALSTIGISLQAFLTGTRAYTLNSNMTLH